MHKNALLFVVMFFLFTGCTGYGSRLEFNGDELFYTKAISKEEANKLGNFLMEQHFFTGNKISVQIDKIEGVYHFKMVSKEGSENSPENVANAQSFATSLSDQVFNGAPVNFHFCDAYFKTKLEVPFSAQ